MSHEKARARNQFSKTHCKTRELSKVVTYDELKD